MRHFPSSLCLVILLAGSMHLQGQEWTQWRGPDRNGVQPQAVIPVEWSDTKNVQWKTPLPGMGISSPITWQDRIFIAAAERQ
ncbi:MAG: serine/threonine protein kinase, partial [Pirellulaceae bacterium]